MRAYKHLITIQQKTTTRGSMGEEIVEWTDHLTEVPANYDPLRGREYFSAMQEQTETAVRFWTDYFPSVESNMRIVFDGKFYDIEAAINFRGEGRQLEIMTREGLTNG